MSTSLVVLSGLLAGAVHVVTGVDQRFHQIATHQVVVIDQADRSGHATGVCPRVRHRSIVLLPEGRRPVPKVPIGGGAEWDR